VGRYTNPQHRTSVYLHWTRATCASVPLYGAVREGKSGLFTRVFTVFHPFVAPAIQLGIWARGAALKKGWAAANVAVITWCMFLPFRFDFIIRDALHRQLVRGRLRTTQEPDQLPNRRAGEDSSIHPGSHVRGRSSDFVCVYICSTSAGHRLKLFPARFRP